MSRIYGRSDVALEEVIDQACARLRDDIRCGLLTVLDMAISRQQTERLSPERESDACSAEPAAVLTKHASTTTDDDQSSSHNGNEPSICQLHATRLSVPCTAGVAEDKSSEQQAAIAASNVSYPLYASPRICVNCFNQFCIQLSPSEMASYVGVDRYKDRTKALLRVWQRTDSASYTCALRTYGRQRDAATPNVPAIVPDPFPEVQTAHDFRKYRSTHTEEEVRRVRLAKGRFLEARVATLFQESMHVEFTSRSKTVRWCPHDCVNVLATNPQLTYFLFAGEMDATIREHDMDIPVEFKVRMDCIPEQVPHSDILQVHAYMMMTNAPYAYYVQMVLGSDELHIIKMTRDDAGWTAVQPALLQFVRDVQKLIIGRPEDVDFVREVIACVDPGEARVHQKWSNERVSDAYVRPWSLKQRSGRCELASEVMWEEDGDEKDDEARKGQGRQSEPGDAATAAKDGGVNPLIGEESNEEFSHDPSESNVPASYKNMKVANDRSTTWRRASNVIPPLRKFCEARKATGRNAGDTKPKTKQIKRRFSVIAESPTMPWITAKRDCTHDDGSDSVAVLDSPSSDDSQDHAHDCRAPTRADTVMIRKTVMDFVVVPETKANCGWTCDQGNDLHCGGASSQSTNYKRRIRLEENRKHRQYRHLKSPPSHLPNTPPSTSSQSGSPSSCPRQQRRKRQRLDATAIQHGAMRMHTRASGFLVKNLRSRGVQLQ